MIDLISRQAAIDCEYQVKIINDIEYVMLSEVQMKMRKLPSAQSESKTGKWIEAYDPFNRISGRCSVCGWEAHLYEDDVVGMNYCPNCGARMEGEIE